jgi:hypothetical protein
MTITQVLTRFATDLKAKIDTLLAGKSSTSHTHTGSDGTSKIAYSNVSGTPTIGSGTITLQQGGEVKGSFSVNQTGNTTITLDDG